MGQTAGYFMGYVFFMALESYGLVTLPSFLQFWAVIFIITTTFVAILKSEAGAGEVDTEEPDLGVAQTYKLLFDILRLKVMPTTIAMLLTCKVGFAAADAVSGLKLVEAGVPKDKLAMLAIPMMPLQIVLPWIISRFDPSRKENDILATFLILGTHLDQDQWTSGRKRFQPDLFSPWQWRGWLQSLRASS